MVVMALLCEEVSILEDERIREVVEEAAVGTNATLLLLALTKRSPNNIANFDLISIINVSDQKVK